MYAVRGPGSSGFYYPDLQRPLVASDGECRSYYPSIVKNSSKMGRDGHTLIQTNTGECCYRCSDPYPADMGPCDVGHHTLSNGDRLELNLIIIIYFTRFVAHKYKE